MFEEVTRAASQPSVTAADDVLILAGDIGNPYSDAYMRFLKAQRALHKTVMLVPGNHEYYMDGVRDIDAVGHQLARVCLESGVILLDNADAVVGGLRFVGSTCWPNIPQSQEKALKSERYGLVTRISHNGRVVDTADIRRMHSVDVAYLDRVVRASKEPCVVITHYPPTHLMANEAYEHSPDLGVHFNPGLLERVAKTTNVPLWLCGHAHTSKRFWGRGGSTLVGANCVAGGHYDPAFVIELIAR